MSLNAAASVLVIFLLSQPEVRGQTDWGVTYSSHQICVLKGSTVDIPCTYTYPSAINHRTTVIQSSLWFTYSDEDGPVDLRSDSNYSGRVEYLFKQNDCTLRIKDLRETDSAEYKFMFTTNQQGGSVTGSPGVTLTVTDLQVVVESVWTEADLRCHSSCKLSDNPSYVWYKDGKKMNEQTSSLRVSRSDNSYSCALSGHEDQCSAAVYAPKSVSVSPSPSDEVMEGSSVTLTCSSDANPAASHTWYKLNGNQGRQTGNTGYFSSIQSSDSGEYYCEAENKLGKKFSQSISIKVKYAPTFCSVSVNPTGEISENRRVTLSCSSDGDPTPEYTWYKRNSYGYLRKGSELEFSSIKSSDSGEYYCSVNNYLGTGRASSLISIDVKYAPKLPSVSVSPSGEIVEGGSVTLSCSSDANPTASYTWYKKTGNQRHQTGNTNDKYFRSIKSSDSGEYYCLAENEIGERSSESISVKVKYAPKLPSVSVSPSGEIVEGSSVTLSCSSDANPAANYTWYKKTGDPELIPPGKGPRLSFSSIQSSDFGQYYCEAENRLGKKISQHITVNVMYAPKLPSVSVSPSGEIVEGSSVTLTCSSDANPAANYTWFKEDEDQQLSPLGKGPNLNFSSIQPSDFGQYYCEAEDKLGRRRSKHANVNRYYAPKLPSVSVSPSGEIVEGGSVTLTCSSDANPEANYTWYKEEVDSPKFSGEIFTITDLSAEHSGDYVCFAYNEKGHHNSSVHVTVVTGNSTFIINLIRLTLMLLMMTPLLLLTLWMRKKKTLSSTTEPKEPAEMMELDSNPEYENVSDVPAAQTEDTEEQEDMV